MSTYQELLAKKAALEKQAAELERELADARRSERAGVINQIRALMAQHGISMSDISAGKPPRTAKAGASESGGKVAPKYRDTSTGETWSGRGLKPKWLQAAIASGRKLEDFKI